MNIKTIHYIFLSLSLAICIFIAIDAEYLPSKRSMEKIRQLSSNIGGWSGSPYQSTGGGCVIQTTNEHWYDVSGAAYSLLVVGDTITVLHSSLTGAKQAIEIKGNNTVHKFDISILVSLLGLPLLIILFLVATLFMIFYEKIRYQPGRTKLCIAVVVVTFFLFYYHLS